MRLVMALLLLGLVGCMPSPSENKYKQVSTLAQPFARVAPICRGKVGRSRVWPWHYESVFDGCMANQGWLRK